MSAYLMGRVFYAELPAHLKLTLLALADHAHDDGTNIKVGQARLAVKVGAGERTVRGHVGELRDLGYIRKVGREGSHGQDRHEIVVDKLPTDEQIKLFRGTPRPAAESRPADVAGRESEHANHKSRPAAGRRLDRQPAAAEPSVNRQKPSPSAKAPRERPTHDSIYLAERINERAESSKGNLTPAALQRFVDRFGARAVEDALRELYGYPPGEPILAAYPYLEATLTERAAEVRSLEEQREDRDAAAELAAHARVVVEDAGDVGAEVPA